MQLSLMLQEPSTSRDNNRYGWRIVDNTFEAVKFTFDSVYINTNNNTTLINEHAEDERKDDAAADYDGGEKANNEPDGSTKELCEGNKFTMQDLKVPRGQQDTENNRCHHCEDNAGTTNVLGEHPYEMHQAPEKRETLDSGIANIASLHNNATDSMSSIRSIGSFVCRICQNAEHPERLVSPCLCKGSLTYVHIDCLEHWISSSGKTTCELCQFRYKTVQNLRYTCLQSLRMWYSHSMSRRALQEDCQMFSLLTLVAFGIVGTILVGIQYYGAQERNTMTAMTRVWTKGWLLFFLFTTFTVYFMNVYMIVRGQLTPWYRWWQSAREIKLILENRKTVPPFRRLRKPETTPEAVPTHLQDAYRNVPVTEQEVTVSRVILNLYVNGENDGRRHALVPIPSVSDDTMTAMINNQQQLEQEHQPQDEQHERHQQDNRNQVAVSLIDI